MEYSTCQRCKRPIQQVIYEKIIYAFDRTNSHGIYWDRFWGKSIEGQKQEFYYVKSLCPSCIENLFPGILAQFFRAAKDIKFAEECKDANYTNVVRK